MYSPLLLRQRLLLHGRSYAAPVVGSFSAVHVAEHDGMPSLLSSRRARAGQVLFRFTGALIGANTGDRCLRTAVGVSEPFVRAHGPSDAPAFAFRRPGRRWRVLRVFRAAGPTCFDGDCQRGPWRKHTPDHRLHSPRVGHERWRVCVRGKRSQRARLSIFDARAARAQFGQSG